MPSYTAIILSPIGKLGIVNNHDILHRIDFLPNTPALLAPQNSFAKEIIKKLNTYFVNPNFIFDIPLELEGTTFQQKVWQALKNIPQGETVSYGELAKKLKTGPRAVGNACRRNPIPVIIPCHRVVAANHLGGYSGAIKGTKIDIKKWLLQHERAKII